MDNPTTALLSDIELFLERAGMPPSNFGSAAIGDPNLIRHLRSGRELRFATIQRVRAFMAAHEVPA